MSTEGLISPDELRRITSAKEMEKVKELLEKKKKIESDAASLYTTFMEREIRPDAKQRISTAVRQAAERGERELLIFRFSSDWCRDKGRAINNFDPEWPESLTGFARRAYDYYRTELEPMGYRARAQILDFPGGMPGDVGFFLAW